MQVLEQEVGTLYEDHSGALLRFARASAGNDESAREGVQEAFMRYFIERSYGREIRNPKAWLFEVTRNYLTDRVTTQAAQREVAEEGIENIADITESPDLRVGAMQAAQLLAVWLSLRELECLRLRTCGMSYEEIGDVMQVRIGTVGALVARAYGKIRKFAESGVCERTIAAAVFYLIEEMPACPRA